MTTSFKQPNSTALKRARELRTIRVTLLALTLGASGGFTVGGAHAESVKIVGIGAASCQDFLGEIKGRPDVEKNFFAWAQGYMSGLLIRAPAGKDEGLDLTPPELPLLKQAEFLRSYCSRHTGEDFSDAVNMLYRTLRAPSG